MQSPTPLHDLALSITKLYVYLYVSPICCGVLGHNSSLAYESIIPVTDVNLPIFNNYEKLMLYI